MINIVIHAEIANMDEADLEGLAVQAAEGLWIRFTDKPLTREEKFDVSDLPYLAKGLQMVKSQISNNSIYENTLVIINDLQYSICDFQKEGLTAAIIEWASKAFGFEAPTINVRYEKEINRYIFDFDLS